MRKIFELCADLVRKTPLWLYWLTSIIYTISGSIYIGVLSIGIAILWAPSISYYLLRRYPTLTANPSLKWYAVLFVGIVAGAGIKWLWPHLQGGNTWLDLLLGPPLGFCYFWAIGTLSGTISRLEVIAGLARPEEVGRNTFGAFLCVFYFPLGGLVLINRRLNKLYAALPREVTST